MTKEVPSTNKSISQKEECYLLILLTSFIQSLASLFGGIQLRLLRNGNRVVCCMH